MIDVHAHYLPRSLLDRVSAGLERGVGYDAEHRIISFPSSASRPVPAPLTELDSRALANVGLGISLQILSPWLDIAGDDLPTEMAVPWARALNDLTAEDLRDRAAYRAFATLPVVDGPSAAAELNRAVVELGFVGGAIPTQVNGRNLDEVGLEPLFAEAEALGVPLFVHPHRVLGSERLGRDFLNNVCGNPFETTVAALSLFYDGLFDRHPRLKVLLAHCGGTLPMLAGRAARASATGAATRRPLADADEVLGCFYYDTVIHDTAALAFAIKRLGPRRMAMGSDQPFPMLVSDPASAVREAVSLAGGGDCVFELITSGVPGQLIGEA